MGHYQIKTHLRLKPSVTPSTEVHVSPIDSCVRVNVKHAWGGPPRHHNSQLVFHFDSLIQSTSQEAIFNQCASEIVNDVLVGYNGTILAYGQSNSGKTFSMSGDLKSSTQRGIIPRAIHQIFVEKESKPEAEIAVHVSYLEVYNEVIHDLLAEELGSANLVMPMEEGGHIELKGLSQIPCNMETVALKLFSRGERRRIVAANTLNRYSNRSHCIFTIYVERHANRSDCRKEKVARLNLVDLAGFKRFKGLDPHQQLEKEIMNINKSLTFLEQVVAELFKGQGHVSFRQSQLTLLLRDALSGNNKTVFIICALLENEFFDETLRSFRFAQHVKGLKTTAVANINCDPIYGNRHIGNLRGRFSILSRNWLYVMLFLGIQKFHIIV